MKKFTGVIVIFLLAVPILPANAGLIDLNDFVVIPDFDPPLPVTISPDGSSATMSEDSRTSFIGLSNDPFFGEPGISPALGMELLKFDYDFALGQGTNYDEFGAFIFDPFVDPFDPDGFFNPIAEFFTQGTSGATVSFDLSAYIGQTLGIQFQLTALPADLDLNSAVTVSNVRLAPVPEPATMILVGTGLFGLLGLGRKKFRKTC